MLAQLAPLVDALGLPFASAGIVFLRVSGLMIMLPGFGERMVPMRVKLVGALAITAIVAPLLPIAQVPPAITLALVVSEIAIGLAMGTSLRFLAQALLIAGNDRRAGDLAVAAVRRTVGGAFVGDRHASAHCRARAPDGVRPASGAHRVPVA